MAEKDPARQIHRHCGVSRSGYKPIGSNAARCIRERGYSDSAESHLDALSLPGPSLRGMESTIMLTSNQREYQDTSKDTAHRASGG